jgi:hypothetical protein
MFRILLGLFDPEKDPSKRRKIFNQQHGVTSQKRWSNTAVRTSLFGTLGVFVLERKNLADIRGFKLAKCRYYAVGVLRRKWGWGRTNTRLLPGVRSYYTGILKNCYLQEVGGGRGDWMELAQDRDRWRALVGTVRNFWVP